MHTNSSYTRWFYLFRIYLKKTILKALALSIFLYFLVIFLNKFETLKLI